MLNLNGGEFVPALTSFRRSPVARDARASFYHVKGLTPSLCATHSVRNVASEHGH